VAVVAVSSNEIDMASGLQGVVAAVASAPVVVVAVLGGVLTAVVVVVVAAAVVVVVVAVVVVVVVVAAAAAVVETTGRESAARLLGGTEAARSSSRDEGEGEGEGEASRVACVAPPLLTAQEDGVARTSVWGVSVWDISGRPWFSGGEEGAVWARDGIVTMVADPEMADGETSRLESL